jgi:hypothetical protein
MSNLFDIVIPVGPNDIHIISKQIEYTIKNVIGFRNIYLIVFDPSISINGCITIPESIFPFSIDTVAKYHRKHSRNGWYLQQLLKLYAGLVIPNILDKYLVIDSDTFFISPTTFYENGKCLYNYGNEYHLPYFHHMKKLHPSLIKMTEKSGICHHMIFETKYIKELFDMVESHHNDTFYNIFLKNVEHIHSSGASEYEIYFNFIIWKHLNDITIRELKWMNTNTLDNLTDSKLNYISYHWYYRR